MNTEVMHMMLKRTKGWVLAGAVLFGAVGPAVGRPPMVRMGMVNPGVGPVLPRTPMVAPVQFSSGAGTMNARAMMSPMMPPGMATPGMMPTSMTTRGRPTPRMPTPHTHPMPTPRTRSRTGLPLMAQEVPAPPGTAVTQTPRTATTPITNTNPFLFSTNTLSPTLRFLLLEQASQNSTLNPLFPFAGTSLLPPGLTPLPPGLNMGFFPTPTFFPSPVFNPLLLSPQFNGFTPFGFFPGTIGTPFLFRPTTTPFFSPSLMFLAGPGLTTLPLVGLGSLSAGGMTTPATLPFVVALNGDLTLTPQEEREMTRKIRLVHSQTGAAATTIWSASDLNTLLDDLKAHPDRLGCDLPLSEHVLAHINIVPSRSNGNAGLLKNGRRWPELLQSSAFQADRDRIESVIPELVHQAKAGAIQTADVEELEQAVNGMRDRLAGLIRDVPAPLYIRAKRFVVDLQSGIKVLRQPDAANYFNPLYVPPAKSVRELVGSMSKRDLRFAPAVPGDEAAYLVFYQALASYDVSANMQAPSSTSQVVMAK
jgi:hypothetical protein